MADQKDSGKKKKRGSVLQRLGLINTKQLVPSNSPGGAEPPPGSIAATALRGVLKKQSLNNALVWQSRWCVVDPERFEFLYWNKESDEASLDPSYRIRLGDCVSIEYIYDAGKTEGTKIRFIMKPGLRPQQMVFRATNTDESSKWLSTLHKYRNEALGLTEIDISEPEYKLDVEKIGAAAKAESDSDDGLSSDEEPAPKPTSPPPGAAAPTKPPPPAAAAEPEAKEPETEGTETKTEEAEEAEGGKDEQKAEVEKEPEVAVSPDTPLNSDDEAASDVDSENGRNSLVATSPIVKPQEAPKEEPIKEAKEVAAVEAYEEF